MDKIAKIKELKELLSSGTINQKEFSLLKEEVISDDNKDFNVDDFSTVNKELTVEERKKIYDDIGEPVPDFNEYKPTIGNKMFNGFCNFLSLFVSPKDTSDNINDITSQIAGAAAKSAATERLFYGDKGRGM